MRKPGRRKAVALAYLPEMPAPMVVASGTGRAAERIENLAAGAGVPIVEDAVLAQGLEPLDLGGFVPPEYWELVAKVLVFIRKARR